MTPTLMKRSTRALLTAGLLATTPWASQAQPTGDDSQEGRSRWGLGLAVMPEIKPYRDFDGKTEVWPLITFENRWVRVFGPGLEFKLGRSGPLTYGLTLAYAGDGYKSSDAPILTSMDRRRASAWLGGRLGLQTSWAQFSANGRPTR